MSRRLGIDFGRRRIGLALSDPEGRLAVPLTTLQRGKDRADRKAVEAITEIARREGVEALVLGEPLGLDGSAGDAAQRVRLFARRLAAGTGLPVELVNESLTSVEAEERLREAGIDPRRRPEKVDAVAAQILLQEALDRARERGRESAVGAAGT